MVTPRTSQNDNERFESLYEANYKSIYAYVHRRAANSSSDVSDIVSEVFTTAWRRINDVPPSPQDRLWLFGVAHKCLLEHRRRWSHRLRLLSHLGSQPNRIELLESAADPLHLRVREAIRELRPLDRDVILLVYWDGLSHGQAAAVLGCSVNAVALRVRKAKVRLQSRLRLELSATDFSEDTSSVPISSKEQLP
jgi:RNA polymerase sigma-70 factor (ECF subfamily)